MKPCLLDVNLLVALLWPSHEHHARATKWFQRRRSDGWATCPLTEAGFVRIVSNPAFSRDAVSPREAAEVLTANTAAKDHHFWEANLQYGKASALAGARLIGHQQVTDAYLLGLALHRGATLATLDRSIAALLAAKSGSEKLLEIVG